MAEEDDRPRASAPPDEESPAAAAAPPAAESPPPDEDWATRFKYLLADFENYRKRSTKERESFRADVRAALIESLLPLHEAAAKAREAVTHLPPADPVRRGVELLSKEWQSFLDREGVVPVARVGTPFHAEWHEAVAEAPAKDARAEGTVLEIVQQGYRIGRVLLRPAKVVVARAKPAARAPAEEPETAVVSREPGPV